MCIEYEGKNVVLIGPGISKGEVDMSVVCENIHYTACLNDLFVVHPTDIYFVGLRNIFKYVAKHANQDAFQKAKKLIFCLDKSIQKHKSRFTCRDFARISKKYENCEMTMATNVSSNIRSDITYKGVGKKDTLLLDNLFMNFPSRNYYYRSKSLTNSLQILVNMGFKNIILCGFMDSPMLRRDKDSRRHRDNVYKGKVSAKEKQLRNIYRFQVNALRVVHAICREKDIKLWTLTRLGSESLGDIPFISANGLSRI